MSHTRSPWWSTAALPLLLWGSLSFGCSQRGNGPTLPEPSDTPKMGAAVEGAATDAAASMGEATAVFAGGCFWCTEAAFEELAGVTKVISGYAGGDAKGANYKDVGAGKTDHAESIEITYDPAKITYGQLLRVFFTIHDPTQLNRQGPDHGRQYRSTVFVATPAERTAVEAYIAKLNDEKVFSAPVVTTVESLTKFYPAEDYHQDYVKHHPDEGYVRVNSIPKIHKVHEKFPDLVKKAN